MTRRYGLTFLLLIILVVAYLYAPSSALLQGRLAGQAFTPGDVAAQGRQAAVLPIREILMVIDLICLAGLWFPVLFKRGGIFGLVLLMALAACGPKPSGFVEVGSNETAFVVDMNPGGVDNQSQTHTVDFWKSAQRIGVYRISIVNDQYGNPTQKVIKVSRAPVSISWTFDPAEATDAKYLSIRVQTSDSQGYRIPLQITAMIDEVPTSTTDSTGNATMTGAAAAYLYYFGDIPLNDVLNTTVRTKIAGLLFDTLVAYDTDHSDAQVSKAVQDAYKVVSDLYRPMGINITALSPGDGLNWDNPQIQEGKDKKALTIQNQAIAAQEATRTYVENLTYIQSTQMAAQGRATQQYIAGQSDLAQASVYATATTIAGRSAAQVLQDQGDALNTNPGIIAYTQAQKWDGHLPPSYGGVQTYMSIPAPELTPSP